MTEVTDLFKDSCINQGAMDQVANLLFSAQNHEEIFELMQSLVTAYYANNMALFSIAEKRGDADLSKEQMREQAFGIIEQDFAMIMAATKKVAESIDSNLVASLTESLEESMEK